MTIIAGINVRCFTLPLIASLAIVSSGAAAQDAATILAGMAQGHKTVQQHIEDAFNTAQTAKPEKEVGGWIFHNTTTGDYLVIRQDAKYAQASSITLKPLTVSACAKAHTAPSGYDIVADFHSHPGKSTPASRPSDGDISNARGVAYRVLVITPAKRPKAKGGRFAPETAGAFTAVVETPNFIIWDVSR